MAVAAEAFDVLPEAVAYEAPAVYAVPENERIRHCVEWLAWEVGGLAVGREVAYDPAERDNGDIGYATLAQAIWFAAQGDPKARRVVETDTRTHILECLMKAGIIFEVTMHLDGNGRLIQDGQLLEEVHENALRWAADGPEMRQRTLLEIYNGLLAQQWARLGLLRDQRMLVFSPYPTAPDMTDAQARELGFFPDTRSCAIQMVHMDEAGSVVQEVAFVAGVTEQNGERHDLKAIQALLAELGVAIDISTASAVLGTPIVVPASLPLVEIVSRYDAHASHLAGPVFFGQAVPAQDYGQYVEQCRQRIASIDPLVQDTVEAILRHATSLRHPLDAVRLLHDIAQQHMVDYALRDTSVDWRVFGPASSHYIEMAQRALEVGDTGTFQALRADAQLTAQTGSCPIDIARSLTASSDQGVTANADEECEFISKQCPVCHKENVRTRRTRTMITGSCGCSVRLK